MNSKHALLAAALLLTTAPAWAATDHIVHVGGASLVFTPASTDALVGDTVTFVNDGGFHNVVSDTGAPFAFRCAAGCDGDGGSGTPSGASWTSTITILPAAAHGTINFHCEVHQTSGMVGNISVTNPVDLQSFSID